MVGSSPLARGLLTMPVKHATKTGIIPARAGFTPYRRAALRRKRDHPRSRGVYGRPPQALAPLCGSSPLARGLHQTDPGCELKFGIIPARAGFTLFGGFRCFSPMDHPRSRGVYTTASAWGRTTSGSSPLARGLRQHPRLRHQQGRIIPARAGFTRYCTSPAELPPDHPRSRGVYLRVPRPRLEIHRIIPARAGFTPAPGAPRPQAPDHPRSRGVYCHDYLLCWCGCGSSPLARGLPAGCRRAPLERADHPRSRGVYVT